MSLSIKDLRDDFDLIIKPQLEEILRLLNKLQAQDVSGNIEAVAAKIINELKSTTHDCRCSQILQALQQQEPKGTMVIPEQGNTSETLLKDWKYSYPNFKVGNEQLGYGSNPNSLTWPIKEEQPK